MKTILFKTGLFQKLGIFLCVSERHIDVARTQCMAHTCMVTCIFRIFYLLYFVKSLNISLKNEKNFI